MKRRAVKKKSKVSPNGVALIGWIAFCEFVGMIGGIFTIPQISSWYVTLVKPSFSPPNWVFGPVWTILYALMGFAAYRIWSQGMQKPAVRNVIMIFVIQLVLNFLWSFLFFARHNIFGGFIDIAFLWSMIAYLSVRFEKLDTIAGYAMTPYFLWVSFAMVLNYNLWVLNM